MASVTASETSGQSRAMADHHLRLPDRRDDLRAALGNGLLPAADARRKGLGPPDLRPRHGAAEPVLGPRPAVVRGDRRPLRDLARAGHRRRHLCGRPGADGECQLAVDALSRRRRAGRARRRGRFVQHRARRLRPAYAAGTPQHRVRHRHRRRLGRHVPVRADQPGHDRCLWLVRHTGLSRHRHARPADPGHPACRKFARRQGGDGRDAAVDRQRAPRGARPPQLRAADHGLLRLRLPDRLHHRPLPGLYPRHRHRRRAMRSSRWR